MIDKNVIKNMTVRTGIPYGNKIDNRLNEYNAKTHDALKYFIANADKLTKNQWKDVCQYHRTNPVSPVVQYLLQSPVGNTFADNIASFIIDGTYDKVHIDSSELCYTLLLCLSKEPIKTDTIKRACKLIDTRYGQRTELEFFIEKNINNIPLSNQKAMLEYFLGTKNELKKKTLSYAPSTILKNMNDPAYLMNLVEQYPDGEHIRTCIIQNPCLNDEQKEELWEMGVNPLSINMTTIPDTISTPLYESIMDAFDGDKINITNYRKAKKEATPFEAKSFTNAKNKIYDMVANKQLSPSREYALFLMLQSYNSHATNEIMAAVLRNTCNEEILKEVKKIKSVSSRQIAYHNPQMPLPLIKDKIQEIIKKTDAQGQSKSLQCASVGDGQLLLSYIQRKIEMPMEAYHVLLINNPNDAQVVSEIISAPHLQDEMLKRLKNTIYDKMIANKHLSSVLADLRLSLEKTFNDKQKKSFYTIIKAAYLSTHVPVQYEDNSIIKDNRKHYIENRKLHMLRNEEDKATLYEVAQKIEAYIKDKYHYVGGLCRGEVNAVKGIYDVVNDIQLIKEAIDKNDYTDCPTYYVKQALYDTLYHFAIHNGHALEFYLNVDKLAEDIQPLYDALISQMEKGYEERQY